MHHKRVAQEKDKLQVDLRRLKKHFEFNGIYVILSKLYVCLYFQELRTNLERIGREI